MILSAVNKPKRPQQRGWSPRPANDEPAPQPCARVVVHPPELCRNVPLEQLVRECGLQLIDGKVHS